MFSNSERGDLDDLGDSMAKSVEAGFVSAAKKLAADSDFMDAFWLQGYDRLAKHAREDIQKSIGRRVLAWFAALAFGASIYLATKAGLLK